MGEFTYCGISAVGGLGHLLYCYVLANQQGLIKALHMQLTQYPGSGSLSGGIDIFQHLLQKWYRLQHPIDTTMLDQAGDRSASNCPRWTKV